MKEPVPREQFRVRWVFTAVIGQTWPLLALCGLPFAVSIVWWTSTGDPGPARMTWAPLELALPGLVGSYTLHEAAHAALLRRLPTVEHLWLDRQVFSLSVIPFGALRPWQLCAVAASGPMACGVVGIVALLSRASTLMGFLYLGHLLFLLPLFGDGKAFLGGLRGTAAEQRLIRDGT